MSTAFITLSREGSSLIPQLKCEFSELDCYVHAAAGATQGHKEFLHITELSWEIFPRYKSLIYAVPCGVVVRSVADLVTSKLTDPAVVVLDVGARWAISLLSGHEGGANDLAVRVANVFDAEAIITTTTEAVKDLIVGVGCRSGIGCSEIVDAIQQSLAQIHMPLSSVRLLASASVKREEEGLLQAAATLKIPIRFLSMEEIQRCSFTFSESEFVRKSVGVSAVAEPVSLMAGRRTRLLLQKTTYNGITVAIARESCTSLA
jgi:cobalt-precorrin 5A hydrolase